MTKAADFRIQLDLLLSEHVVIIAKTAAGAVNHTDDYTAYATLLIANFQDTEVLLSNAFGNTSATQIMRTRNALDGDLVDYAIAVVIHDGDRATSDMQKLNSEVAPQLAAELGDAAGAAPDKLQQAVIDQAAADKTFIDDLFGRRFDAFYRDLHAAYARSSTLGDLVARGVASKFPDKFPGDPTSHGAEVRLSAAQALQERSYLVTMSTAALVAGRNEEAAPASAAVGSTCTALTAAYGRDLAATCALEASALTKYAGGDATARTALLSGYVDQFAALARVDSQSLAVHESALLKAVDDQRAKDFAALAPDDRAAATSAQPIADSAAT